MYFYQRLRDLREDKDLFQEDIAKLLQTTQQTYSLWERGDREIPLHQCNNPGEILPGINGLHLRTNKQEEIKELFNGCNH